jgi:RNA polymerase sigma-70 factor (ECF subfamily)
METQRINELAGLMKKDVNSSFDEFYELTKKAVYLNLASFIPSQNICEDLEQETYLKFLDSLPSFDPSKSALGLLYVISRNLALSYLRDHKREVSLSQFEDYDNYFEGNALPPDPDGEAFYLARKVLKDREYQIVLLHAGQGLTHQQIADELHLPLGTVTWTYNNALRKIRKEADHEKKHRH